jgi:hypothetical protein
MPMTKWLQTLAGAEALVAQTGYWDTRSLWQLEKKYVRLVATLLSKPPDLEVIARLEEELNQLNATGSVPQATTTLASVKFHRKLIDNQQRFVRQLGDSLCESVRQFMVRGPLPEGEHLLCQRFEGLQLVVQYRLEAFIRFGITVHSVGII